ncbi:MAG: GNAT family N-acetyltransferase [Chloroflexota bacterium]
MTTEFRDLTLDDYEQAAIVEQRAFYNRPDSEFVERMRKFYSPEWTVGAFIDGTLVADTRAIPMMRRFHGTTTAFGAVGPVACAAPYRRRGLVGKLLVLAMERMRDRGQWLSGLHTPHDALYQRYGWERAEAKKGYEFAPKDVGFRLKSTGGRTEPTGIAEWQRLDKIFREKTHDANGPFVRPEMWWTNAVLKAWDNGKLVDADGVVWVDAQGNDKGYAVYVNRSVGSEGGWSRQAVWIRDFQALDSDAYVGLWEHMLTHDLADTISVELPSDDMFREMCENPHKVKSEVGMGAMLRIVDVEKALAQRPYVGNGSAGFTARIEDPRLAWNDGTWRIESANGHLHAEKTDAEPDVEMSVNTLAPLYSGYMRSDVAANTGFVKVNRPDAIAEMMQVFAVKSAPYSPDYY